MPDPINTLPYQVRAGRRGRERGSLALRRVPRRMLLASTALQAAALSILAVPLRAQPAPMVGPTGGQVVAGSATIQQSAAVTTVNQASQRAAVNWTSFDVGAQHTVQFNQPATTSVILNRVVSPNPSQIAGTIKANGQVVLVNTAGVVFHDGAQVNTSGFVASAVGISNQNFMSGRMVFDEPAQPNARIENRGSLTIHDAGLAALVGPQVVNSGVITARLGRVVLAGVATTTLDFNGDGMLSIDVSSLVRQVPIGPDGKSVTALVTNTGTILAEGGSITLTAAAVRGIMDTLVSVGGEVAAPTVTTATAVRAGAISIAARGGDATVTGTVAATGLAAGQTGGTVAVNASRAVVLGSNARIDVSGSAGGGTVALGTTLARAVSGPTHKHAGAAQGVLVQPGATILADAISAGNGGTVTVLSTKATVMAGKISARGGLVSGNGGYVEVSGGSGFSLTGAIDVSAPAGRIGTILLDPATLTIVDGIGSEDTLLAGGTIAFNDLLGGDATISSALLGSLTGNIILQAETSITIPNTTPVTLSADSSLTLETRLGDISVGSGSPITAQGTGALIFKAGETSTTGQIILQDNLIADSKSGGITLQASGGIVLNGATVAAGLVDLSSSASGISQSGSGKLVAGTLISSGGVAGPVVLANSGNTIGTLGSFALSGSNAFTLTDAAALTVGGPVAAGTDITLTAPTITATGSLSAPGTLQMNAGAGGIMLSGSAVANGGTLVDLNAGAAGISQSGSGKLVAGTLISSGGVAGPVVLANSGNTIGTLGSFALTGSNAFTLTDAAALTVGGPVVAGTDIILTAPTIAATGSLTAPGTLQMNAGAGGVVLSGSAVASGGTLVDLNAGAAGVSQSGSGKLVAGTLISSSGVAGPVVLANSGNTIGTLGSFALSGSNAFTLTDAAALTMGGPVVVGTDITLTAPTITATGSLTAPGTLQLNGGAGGIVLSGSAVANGGTLLDLNAGAAGISQSGSGKLVAGTLISSAGVVGPVALANSGNTIGTLGSFALSGSHALSLTDATALTVGGPVVAGTDITLTAPTLTATGSLSAPGTLQLNGGVGGIVLSGSAVANGGTLVDLNAGAAGISQSGSGKLVAGTLISSAGVVGPVVLANSGNTIGTLGSFALSGSNALSLTDATALTVGGPVVAGTDITLTAPTLTATGSLTAPGTLQMNGGAGGIVLSGSAVANGGTLVDLNAGAAGISQSGSGKLVAGTLISSAGVVGPVVLANSGNTIGTLGSFALSGSNAFTLTDAAALTVGGPVVAGTDITLTAPTIVATGSLSAPGTLQLNGGAGGIVLSGGAVANGGTLVDLNAGAAGISQSGSGKLVTGTLISSGGVAGPVVLANSGNTIGTLGSFALTGSNAFTLTDTAALTVGGPVVAGTDITLTAPTLTATGSLSAPGTLQMNAGAGGITIAAGGRLSFSRIDLSSAGAVTEADNAVIDTGLLRSVGTVSGAIDLASTTNTISQIDSLIANGPISIADNTGLAIAGLLQSTGGDILLRNVAPAGITVTGTVMPGSGGTIAIQTDALAITAPGTFAAGTIEFQSASNVLKLGSGGILASVAGLGNGVVRLGSIKGTTVADAIELIGAFDAGSRPIVLAAKGTIDGTAGWLLNAGTLSGLAGSGVTLSNTANVVGTLASFDVAGGDFTLAQQTPLSVAGTVSATTIGLTASSMTVDGKVAASNSATLAATTGDLTQHGTVIATAGTADLVAAAGTLTQDGLVSARVLLAAANTILLPGGTTEGTDLARLTATQTLTQAGGTIQATSNTGSVVLAGTQGVTLAGVIRALGTAGVVTASGGTLATDMAAAITAGASIGLTGTTSFIHRGTATVTSPGGTATLAATTGDLLQAGTVIAPTAVETAAGTLTMTGTVNAGDSAGLSAGHAVIQNGGLVQASHVVSIASTGTSAGDGIALNSGTIQATGTTGGVTLAADQALTVAATVQAIGGGGSVQATTSHGVLLTTSSGQINAAAGVTLNAGADLLHSGTIAVAGGAAILAANGGSLVQGGSVAAAIINESATAALLHTGQSNAGSAVTLSAGGSVTQTGGLIQAGTTVAISAGGSAATGGLVQASGIIQATGSTGVVTMAAAQDIVLNGSVLAPGTSGSIVAVASGGSLAAQGSAAIGAGASVTLQAATSLSQAGSTAATFIQETAGTDLTHAGQSTASQGVSLVAGGTLSQSGSVSGASVSEAAGGPLTHSGTTAADGTVTLTAGSVLSQTAGLISATTRLDLIANGTAATDGVRQTGGTIQVGDNAGTLAVRAMQDIALGGTVLASGGNSTMRLTAVAGSIAATGMLTAGGTLTGAAGGAVSFGDAPGSVIDINHLGDFSAAGMTLVSANPLHVDGTIDSASEVSFRTGQDFILTGTIAAPDVSIRATDTIALPGVITATGTLSVVSDGASITQSGSLSLGNLTGSAVGNAEFAGTNQIGRLGAFQVGPTGSGTLRLTVASDLTVGGTLNAATIDIDARGHVLTLADGGSFVTSGVPRGRGFVSSVDPSVNTPARGGPGILLRADDVRLAGRNAVTDQGGGSSTLQITVTGDVDFGPVGLQAPGTWLIVNLTSGRADGRIAVGALNLTYVDAAKARSDLTGTIGGFAGAAAASQAVIEPFPTSNFRLNACALESVNCILLPNFTIPQYRPATLPQFFFSVLGQDDALSLPMVSNVEE